MDRIGERDFSRAVISALRKQGKKIYATTWLPGKDGSYINGETGYKVDDNGTSRILKYEQVRQEAGA